MAIVLVYFADCCAIDINQHRPQHKFIGYPCAPVLKVSAGL